MKNLGVALAAALLAAACQPIESSPPQSAAPALALPAIPAPHYSDALSGLYTAPASSVPLDKAVDYYAPRPQGTPARAVLTMALVPGANYGKLRGYLAAAAKAAPDAASDLKVQPVLQRAVEIVKQRYPWLELMDDVATAQERNVSLTLVMDIRGQLGHQAGERTAVEIEVVVFDERRRPVSRLLVQGQVPPGRYGYGFQDAAGVALSELAAKSKDTFN